MSAPRLTADFWVSAYLARLRLADIPAYVLARGDAQAGAIWIKQCPRDGTAALFARRYDLAADETRWTEIARGPEAEIDAMIARERARDGDLWVIEVEDRGGRTLLDAPGL